MDLAPKAAPYIAWDSVLAGYGVKVHPSGRASHLVTYRVGGGGRGAQQRRKVIGDARRMAPRVARARARAILGQVAEGGDPVGERAAVRRVLVEDAFASFLASNPRRGKGTTEAYRSLFRRCMGHLAKRRMADVSRADVESLFNGVTGGRGPSVGNRAVALLSSLYRRACAEHPGLANPVAAWRLGGGRVNRIGRRQVAAVSEALPAWRRGILASVSSPVQLALFMFLLRTGCRLGEALALKWPDVDGVRGELRFAVTKTGLPLRLPMGPSVRRVLSAQGLGDVGSGHVFPSRRGRHRPMTGVARLYGPVSEAGGVRFWCHGLRNAFITVALRELGLADSLVKRLVNHAQGPDVTEGYASAWSMAQLSDAQERIAGRVDELMGAGGGPLGWGAEPRS